MIKRIKNCYQRLNIPFLLSSISILLNAFLLIYICLSNCDNTLDIIKKFGDSLKPLVEIIAIITAGIWTYVLFVKNRIDYPLVRISHEISFWNIDEQHICLSVFVTINNSGKVLLIIENLKIYIQKILPTDKILLDLINNSALDDLKEGRVKKLFLENEPQIAWSEIGYRENKFKKGLLNIEPGESEEFQYEFILNNSVKKVRIISFISNPKFRRNNTGWRKTTIFDISEGKMLFSEDQNDDSATKSRQEPERTLPFSRSEPERIQPAKEETASRPEPERIITPKPKEGQ